jgi:hypothetical protein
LSFRDIFTPNGSGKIDAGERGGLAVAAGLKGFELVEIFDKQAVAVSFISLDTLHVALRRKGPAG